MIYINNECTSPYYNLALEEYALKNLASDDNCIILWQNRPSVIIGKHQNTMEEINLNYVQENDICVARRLSGGGAVYHDFGNLNFTFIIKDQGNNLYDFKKYTKPVIDALKMMGVTAQFNSRNDITIDGKKFSGNAQYIYKNRLLHHGTLLFDSELEKLQYALNVSGDKIQSKGIKSVRSRVTNIIDYLPEPFSIKEFKSLLLKCLIENEENACEYVLTQDDLDSINTLKSERYETWNWNFGESPSFNFKNSARFEGGKVEILLDVKRGGIIQNCSIYGDFFSCEDITVIEEKLKNQRYDYDAIYGLLSHIEINRFFGGITLEEILSCFFPS